MSTSVSVFLLTRDLPPKYQFIGAGNRSTGVERAVGIRYQLNELPNGNVRNDVILAPRINARRVPHSLRADVCLSEPGDSPEYAVVAKSGRGSS